MDGSRSFGLGRSRAVELHWSVGFLLFLLLVFSFVLLNFILLVLSVDALSLDSCGVGKCGCLRLSVLLWLQGIGCRGGEHCLAHVRKPVLCDNGEEFLKLGGTQLNGGAHCRGYFG